jgi:Ca2+-binding RTX toxin-like protein
MVNVTVPGAAGRTTTLAFDSTINASMASQISVALSAALQSGSERAADNAFGPPPPLGGRAGLFTQSLPGVTMLPRGYADVVNSASVGVIFGSGDPNEHVLSGSGNLAFYATGGSGTVLTGGGGNLISIPVSDSGNWLIQTGGGADTIIARGTGSDTINAGPSGNAVTLGGGQYQVASVGQDTITAGTGSTTIDASGSPGSGAGELVFAGTGKLVFVGGASGATIFGGAGSETVTGGSGGLYAKGGTAGNNVLTAGTGAATLFGGGGGDVLTAAGSGPQALFAGTGNETLTGASATGADTFFGGAGADQITGGVGSDTFVSGAGQATVNAAGSSNLFRFVDGSAGGTMLVNDLTNASQVNISLAGYGPNEAANAIAGQTSTPNSVSVKLSDNTTITFANITHLSSGNFS